MTKHHILNAAKAMAVVLAVLVAPTALADHRRMPPPREPTHSVPEFDPAAGGALFALLAGGGLLIANRRRSK